jgi:hypothetical protein
VGEGSHSFRAWSYLKGSATLEKKACESNQSKIRGVQSAVCFKSGVLATINQGDNEFPCKRYFGIVLKRGTCLELGFYVRISADTAIKGIETLYGSCKKYRLL